MCENCTWVLRLVNVSVALFAVPLLVSLVFLFHRRKERYKPGRSGVMALLFTVGFILSAFFLHYAVGCYQIHHAAAGAYIPTYAEELVDSLFRAVRIFGIPEHYTDFVKDLRAMLSAVMPAGMAWTQNWIVGYATAMNVVIPIAGSALILGIFARAFPKVMLFIKSLPFWREKCYFSSLTPQTVALAKSIVEARRREKKWWHWRPLLVFTDVYVDDETEQSFELVLEAKQLGAICLRDDLTHVRKAKGGKRSYFLMEENEYANLPALMGLVENRNVACMKKAVVYLFVGSNLYERLEKNIRERLKAPEQESLCHRWQAMKDTSFFQKVRLLWQQYKANKHTLASEDLPLLVPVNAHRNLVNNLMVDLPLYEPLVGTDKTELHVTILGNGSIGTEAFLSAYWFGQMQRCLDGKSMQPCDLHIHVVSQDNESTFWDKIDYFNPEIRRTCDRTDTILNWDPQNPNHKNAPYATVTYYQSNVKMGSLGENKPWLQSDYFIIALGSDADNIAVAEKLRTQIGQRHCEGECANAVVAYVVYDTDLCRALNARNKLEHGIYLHAFGDLEQVYGNDNVFMTKSRVLADQTGKVYQQRNADTHIQEQKNRSSEKGNYNHWSDLARAMHITYKIFSMGWMATSVFKDEAKHRTELSMLKRRYARVCGLTADDLTDEDREWQKDLHNKGEYMGWIEHRRWNAFVRSLGYRYSAKRDFSLKLHHCLVECRGPQAADPFCYMTEERWDHLDALRTEDCDYKAYDYPHDDVGDLVSAHAFLQWNRNKNNTLKAPALDEKALVKRCEQSAEQGVYRDMCRHGEDWIIPVACLKSWLSADAYAQLKKEML